MKRLALFILAGVQLTRVVECIQRDVVLLGQTRLGGQAGLAVFAPQEPHPFAALQDNDTGSQVVQVPTVTETASARNARWRLYFMYPEGDEDPERQGQQGSESYPIWSSKVSRWHKHQRPHGYVDPGFVPFFMSVSSFAWVLFFTALMCYIALHLMLIDWPSTRKYHATALLIWLAAAGLQWLIVNASFGPGAGGKWLIGYFLELVFSLENVFIYHVIVSAFNTPRRQSQKALFTVICCQIVFQMFFFMGLASWLQSIVVLPYLLGLWLLYVGFQTWNGHDEEEFDVNDSLIVRTFKRLLGDRLLKEYDDGGSIFVVHKGRVCVTMLGPVLCCLLLIDLIMEVDVTLTKIEEIHNHYIGFTSSAAAAFAVPELFFVFRDLFRRYAYLKYGVCFALLFFGMQLLLHQLVHIPDMIGIIGTGAAMLLCALCSPNHLCEDTLTSEGESESETPHRRRTDRERMGADVRLPPKANRQPSAGSAAPTQMPGVQTLGEPTASGPSQKEAAVQEGAATEMEQETSLEGKGVEQVLSN